LRPLIASMATLALNSGLWVRRLLNSFGEGFAYGESPFQGRYPASEVNDGDCPEKPGQVNPLVARLKARAASEGVTLKQLLRSTVEPGRNTAPSRADLTRSAATLSPDRTAAPRA
jgi:hypothetical protein